MTKQIIKMITAGILAGILFLLMPFLLIGVLAVFLIIPIVIRYIPGKVRDAEMPVRILIFQYRR